MALLRLSPFTASARNIESLFNKKRSWQNNMYFKDLQVTFQLKVHNVDIINQLLNVKG